MSLQPREPNSQNDINRAESLKVWNCTNCRRRKVRCDRRHPCAQCYKIKSECVFPVSGRIPRRSRNAEYHGARAKKQVELVGRLRRLEAMVGDLGSQVEKASVMSQDDYGIQPVRTSTNPAGIASMTLSKIDQPNQQLDLQFQSQSGNLDTMDHGSFDTHGVEASIEDSSQFIDDSGDLIEDNDGDLIVKDRFWTVFCKEVEQIFEAVHGPTNIHFDEASSSALTSTSGDQNHNRYYNFLLRHTTAKDPRDDLYPLPSQMLFLWQTYVDNVDPFIKVLHVPSITKVIRELRGSYDSLSPSMRALVMVVALAAIMSLEDESVRANFDSGKMQLLTRYRLGTEQALSQADFLSNCDMVLLQALTLFLSVLQHTGEANSAWLLTGVLIRAAASERLHRDSSHFCRLTLFEKEMRRRLWWQICFIDSRSVHRGVSAFKISEDMFDTEIPANLNDAEIFPEMTMPPPTVGDGRWTDMTLFIIHCEIWTLSQRLRSMTTATTNNNSPRDIDALLKEFHRTCAKLETTHLCQLNPNSPIQAFTETTTRLSLTKISLILHSTQASSNPSHMPFSASSTDTEQQFTQALSLLTQTTHLQTTPHFHPYHWSLLYNGEGKSATSASQHTNNNKTKNNQLLAPATATTLQALHIVLTHLHKTTAFTSTYPHKQWTWTSPQEEAYNTAKTALSSLQTPSAEAEAEAKATPRSLHPHLRKLTALLEKIEHYRLRRGGQQVGTAATATTTTPRPMMGMEMEMIESDHLPFASPPPLPLESLEPLPQSFVMGGGANDTSVSVAATASASASTAALDLDLDLDLGLEIDMNSPMNMNMNGDVDRTEGTFFPAADWSWMVGEEDGWDFMGERIFDF